MSQTKQERNKAAGAGGLRHAVQPARLRRGRAVLVARLHPAQAHIAPGREGLFNLVGACRRRSSTSPASIVADGDFVIVHGRFSGFGAPANWIAADILRIEDGILVEHWDVIQDEATEEQSKSGDRCSAHRFPSDATSEKTIG